MYNRKLVLTNPRRTPYALTNHFDDTYGLTDAIQKCKSAEEFCMTANKYHRYRKFGYTWFIDSDCKENTRLKYVDTLGNVFYLIATKAVEEEKHFTKEELEIIKTALIEYEENHYETEDRQWQRTINSLIGYLR